jgi:hypothetical protein
MTVVFCDSDDFGYFPLEEAEIHSFLPDVFTDCDEEFEITGKLLFLRGISIENECRLESE